MTDELRTDRWKEKTDFVPGLAPGTEIPETRYQVLNGAVFTLQVWNSGSTTRGEMTLSELEKQLGQPITKEGWYDHAGKFLGSDAGLE